MIVDISYFDIFIGSLSLVFPLGFFIYFKIPLSKSLLISAIRMIVQLLMLALYLEILFELNNLWINCTWVFSMIMIGVYTSIKKIGLKFKYLVIPLSIASISSILIVDSFFIGAVLKLDYVFDARYFIPISGMILGNSLNHNIVGLSTYFKSLRDNIDLYQFILSNTSDRKLALRPFIKEGAIQALNPMIASMSVIGLISLPGMMTGQILGGSSPIVAIKYQIMIILAIFVGSTINLFLSIIISNIYVFDAYGNLKTKIFRNRN